MEYYGFENVDPSSISIDLPVQPHCNSSNNFYSLQTNERFYSGGMPRTNNGQ